MTVRRRRDDDSVESWERLDVGDDRGSRPVLGTRPALRRACHHGHLAAERHEVPKYVASPVAAADEAYDHACTVCSAR